MATVEMNMESFKQTVEKPGIVFIDFWAAWCGPCRAFAPTYEKVSEVNADITFAKVDTEAEQELAASFQIRSIPTLMIFRDGIPLFAQPGALPQAALEELVAKARELDMDKVRAEIAAQDQQQQPPQKSQEG
jgi:thioredoxin 1